MKKTLALSAALLSTALANADITLHMNLELNNQTEETSRVIDSEVVVNTDEVTRVVAQDLCVDIAAQQPENDKVELDFVVHSKNEDDTWEVITAPSIKANLDQEAKLLIANDTESLELTVVAHQN